MRRCGVPASCSDGSRAGSDQVLDLVVALVEDAQLVHPPVDVAAAVGPRHPDVVADRDGHRPPGSPQLVGDLHARRGGADDQHLARRDLPGLAVAQRGDLLEVAGQVPGEGGHLRLALRPGRHDDGPAAPRAVVGVHAGTPRPSGATPTTVVCGRTGAPNERA